MKEIVWMLVALLGVLGLMFLTFFGLRMFSRRISTTGGRLRVIDRATLGRDSMILVVSVCGNLILVGVSPHRVEKLTDLEMSEEEYVELAFSSAQKNPVLPFSDILSSFIGKKKESKESDKGKDKDDESL